MKRHELLRAIQERELVIDGLQLERAVFVSHISKERERNARLQTALDELNARYARMQRRALEVA